MSNCQSSRRKEGEKEVKRSMQIRPLGSSPGDVMTMVYKKDKNNNQSIINVVEVETREEEGNHRQSKRSHPGRRRGRKGINLVLWSE